MRVRVELANPDHILLPDMYTDVEIAAGAKRPLLAVPEDAIIDSGTRKVVILDKGEGRFEPREVNTWPAWRRLQRNPQWRGGGG